MDVQLRRDFGGSAGLEQAAEVLVGHESSDGKQSDERPGGERLPRGDGGPDRSQVGALEAELDRVRGDAEPAQPLAGA